MELPRVDRLRWLVRTSAFLVERGAEPVRGLVEPTRTFFPDRYDGSPQGAAKLLARTFDHAGFGDLPVSLAVQTPEGVEVGGCSSGACGTDKVRSQKIQRVRTSGDGYVITLAATELRHPVVASTTCARAAGLVFLLESDAASQLQRAELDGAVDVATALLGFGILQANGSHIVSKGCSGLSVHSATTLPEEEIGVLLAVFTALFGGNPRPLLDDVPKEAFALGERFVKANRATIDLVRADPALIARDLFPLEAPKSWFARILGGGDDLADLERSLAKRSARGDLARAADRRG